MKTSRFLLLVVGLMALASCGDTASPEPAAVSDSANTIDLNAAATVSAPATNVAQPTATPELVEAPTPAPRKTPVLTATVTPTSESLYDLGKESLTNGEIGDAITKLSNAIELKPDFGDAYYLRGLALALEEEYDEAIADFEMALELDPNRADGGVALAGAYAGRGVGYALRGDYDEAIADFEKAISLGIDNDDVQSGLSLAYLRRGLDHLDEGDDDEAVADFDRAIADFERIIAADPNNTDAKIVVAGAYLMRAVVFYEDGYFGGKFAYFDRAFADLDRSLELDPNNVGARVAIADAYLWRGLYHDDEYDNEAALADFERSIASSEEAIELYPDSAEAKVAAAGAYLWRGTVHSEQGKYDKALADFERVLGIYPDNFGTDGIRWDANNEIAKIKLELSEGIAWTPCEFGLKCGFVEVPADYRNPEASSIRIGVNVRRADLQDERIGYLLVNPGGPGVSGLELVEDSDFVFTYALLHRFDIIGFDPRGVGASEPEFACGAPGERLALLHSIEGDIDTTDEIAAGEAAANLCIESMGPVGGLLHSEYVARDMDEIRKALGEEQISYLGFSYGSTLGVWYATLFPESVRAMVVDGADNPVDRADTQQERVDEAVEEWAAFEELMEQALTACESAECLIYNEGDPIGYYKSAVAKLHLVNSAAGDVPYAGFLAVLTTLYSEELWPALWEGLYELKENDDPGILLEFAAVQLGDDLTAPNFTAHVNCLDGLALHPELDRATRFEDSNLIDDAIAEKLPLIDAIDPSGHSACPFYDQFAPSPLDGPLDGGGVPILVVGNHTDPATPFAESEELVTDTLNNGYLLETSHARHVVYPDNDCVNEYVHSALIEAVYPDERVFCERED